MAECEHKWQMHNHPVSGHDMPFCLNCGRWDTAGIATLHADKTHIERINDWDNPAAIINTGEFPAAPILASPTKKPATKE